MEMIADRVWESRERLWGIERWAVPDANDGDSPSWRLPRAEDCAQSGTEVVYYGLHCCISHAGRQYNNCLTAVGTYVVEGGAAKMGYRRRLHQGLPIFRFPKSPLALPKRGRRSFPSLYPGPNLPILLRMGGDISLS